MKRLYLIILFVYVTIYAFGQSNILVEGYFIQRFDKNEILSKIKNDSLRNQGKSFIEQIDYNIANYFFTIKTDSIVEPMMNEDDISSILKCNPNYKNIEVYKFPPYNDKINNILNDKSLKVTDYNWNKNDAFYCLKNDSVNLYKIYYIKGNAYRYNYNKYSTNMSISLAIDWNILPNTINKNIPSFYIYIFYDIIFIDSEKPPMNFYVWK